MAKQIKKEEREKHQATTTAITYLQKLQLERTERFRFDPWEARKPTNELA